jgi:nifR3 family TIM-barrel protein
VLGVPLQIGPVRLETNLLLAPIAGWCELAWRVSIRELGGVGLASTDLLSPRGLICSSDAARDLARTHDLDRPIGMQLYGSDPAIMAEGARWCVDHGATVVDINMGCPVDKVCKRDGGSRLMRDLDRAERIAAAARAAMPDHVPLTAKMRLGWSDADADAGVAGALACRLVVAGVAAITVHGRTTEQRFKGSCRREGIRRVVEAVGEHTGACTGEPGAGVPVIGNGDVRTPDDAVSMLEETGCAGVMIGRGAFGNPWIFREAWDAQRRRAGLADVPGWEPPTDTERIELIRAYFERMREFRDDRHAMHVIRQKISWLGRTVNGGHCKELREAVRLGRTPADIHAGLDAFVATAPPGAAWPSRPAMRGAVRGALPLAR